MFWFGLFYFAGREFQKSVFTRIGGLGPYLNLDDAIIVFFLVSLIRYRKLNKIKLPLIIVGILVSIIISIVIMSVSNALTYEVQRVHKAALYFPLAIFIAYNFIDNNEKFEIYLKVLFLGSIVASIQYLLYILSRQVEIINYTEISIIRSVGFISFTPILIITSFFISLKNLNKKEVFIFIFGLSLFWLNIIFSQTRSVFISLAITVIILALVFKLHIRLRKTFYFAIISIFIYLTLLIFFPAFDLKELFLGRMISLREQGMNDPTAYTRLDSLFLEWKYFLQSNILFGNGLGYNYFVYEGYKYISWGHIGHIAYLSTLGIFGFIIYSVLIPVKSIKNYLKLIKQKNQEYYLAIFLVTAIALTFNDWIQFWMSASYLGQGAFLAGITYGTLWKTFELNSNKEKNIC
ncbi:MAG TPA: hypothetical protein DHV28_15205 [Ignavibacteriales bacterium]|nr:hypothetical protein [Ignavibacteriales bacterium]